MIPTIGWQSGGKIRSRLPRFSTGWMVRLNMISIAINMPAAMLVPMQQFIRLMVPNSCMN